jgi:hypothetical protein
MHIGPIDIDPADTLPFFFDINHSIRLFREVVSSSFVSLFIVIPFADPDIGRVFMLD